MNVNRANQSGEIARTQPSFALPVLGNHPHWLLRWQDPKTVALSLDGTVTRAMRPPLQNGHVRTEEQDPVRVLRQRHQGKARGEARMASQLYRAAGLDVEDFNLAGQQGDCKREK